MAMTSCSGRSALNSTAKHASSLRRQNGRPVAKCWCAAGSKGTLTYQRDAAHMLVNDHITSNQTVAFGSGQLVNLTIDRIGQLLANGTLKNVAGIAACDAAAHEAAYRGVPLLPLEDECEIDVLIEEADQIDLEANAFIKGLKSQPQQPQLLQLRAVAKRAKKLVVLADSGTVVPRLCGSMPVVVDGEDWESPAEEIDDLFLGDAEIWRRPMFGTANPRGGDNPYVSPDGHNIVDIRFYETLKLLGEDAPYVDIAAEIDNVAGVKAHGLFLGDAHTVYVSSPQGTRVQQYDTAGDSP